MIIYISYITAIKCFDDLFVHYLPQNIVSYPNKLKYQSVGVSQPLHPGDKPDTAAQQQTNMLTYISRSKPRSCLLLSLSLAINLIQTKLTKTGYLSRLITLYTQHVQLGNNNSNKKIQQQPRICGSGISLSLCSRHIFYSSRFSLLVFYSLLDLTAVLIIKHSCYLYNKNL